jgi:hypothetical protein
MSNYTLGDSYGIGNIMSSIYQNAVPIISPGGKLNTRHISDHQADAINPIQRRKRKSAAPAPSSKKKRISPPKKQTNPALVGNKKKSKASKPQKKTSSPVQNIPNIF